MAPVPEELKAVQRLLDLWRAGRSYRAVAANLNAEEVQTKQGRRWHHTTVAKVVSGRGNGTSGRSGHPCAPMDLQQLVVVSQ
ncbi:MAG: recombinase family protein [Chloroflexi bacterium]|nr:recombinase family protein [Chloroflexota bacterium]